MEQGIENFSEYILGQLDTIPKGQVRKFNSSSSEHEGKINLVMTDPAIIMDTAIQNKKTNTSFSHFNEGNMIEMNFVLEGNSKHTRGNLLKQYDFYKGYHNVIYNPQSFEVNHMVNKGLSRCFSVYLRPEKMIGLLHTYVPEFEKYAMKILKGEPFVLHAQANPVSSRVKYLLDTIWDFPVQGSLSNLYFESKVLELFSWQCDSLLKQTPAESKIAARDLEKVYFAKQLLLSNLFDPPTITLLSKWSELNEFKLKKYFKQVFNISIHGFVCEERLQIARRMIYDEQKTISEIAYELGFTHPQHFHRMFKKRFGTTPKALVRD